METKTKMNKDKIILDLCGGSGAWSKPYKDVGYDVRLVTLPDLDVRTYVPPKNVYGVLGAPPCTEFSIVKNRDIPRDLDRAMNIVNACIKIIKETKPTFWAIENPVGLLSQFLGQPASSFQPWWFGDPWTKHTMLWGEFNRPKRQYQKWEDVPKIQGLYVRPGRSKPSIACLHKSHKRLIRSFDPFVAVDDASFRAITPQGFAKAFFEANP